MPKSLTEKFFFSRHLFADVISVHNGNMKHARAIEFDYTNLLAMILMELTVVLLKFCYRQLTFSRLWVLLKSI